MASTIKRCWVVSITPNEERDARVICATMDHSDIRVLVNAFHLFLAGLPRSETGDQLKSRVNSVKCSYKTVEGSLHRSRASRSRLGGAQDSVHGYPHVAETGAGRRSGL